MTCEEARELLWPPEQPRIAKDRVLQARRHVDACESCQDFLAQDARLLDAFREVHRVKAPPEVRERVFDAIARERMRDHRSEPSPGDRAKEPRGPSPSTLVALAASVALIVVSVFAWGEGPFSGSGAVEPESSIQQGSGSAFVEDFLRRAVEAEHIESSDPTEVTAFLSRELGTSVASPVDFPGFELEGAEVCIVEGLRGAVVIYKRNGQVLYHYLIPRGDRAVRDPEPSTVVPSGWQGETSYPSVVTWQSEDLDQALVSDISPEELMEVARELARGA